MLGDTKPDMVETPQQTQPDKNGRRRSSTPKAPERPAFPKSGDKASGDKASGKTRQKRAPGTPGKPGIEGTVSTTPQQEKKPRGAISFQNKIWLLLILARQIQNQSKTGTGQMSIHFSFPFGDVPSEAYPKLSAAVFVQGRKLNFWDPC